MKLYRQRRDYITVNPLGVALLLIGNALLSILWLAMLVLVIARKDNWLWTLLFAGLLIAQVEYLGKMLRSQSGHIHDDGRMD